MENIVKLQNMPDQEQDGRVAWFVSGTEMRESGSNRPPVYGLSLEMMLGDLLQVLQGVLPPARPQLCGFVRHIAENADKAMEDFWR